MGQLPTQPGRFSVFNFAHPSSERAFVIPKNNRIFFSQKTGLILIMCNVAHQEKDQVFLTQKTWSMSVSSTEPRHVTELWPHVFASVCVCVCVHACGREAAAGVCWCYYSLHRARGLPSLLISLPSSPLERELG